MLPAFDWLESRLKTLLEFAAVFSCRQQCLPYQRNTFCLQRVGHVVCDSRLRKSLGNADFPTRVTDRTGCFSCGAENLNYPFDFFFPAYTGRSLFSLARRVKSMPKPSSSFTPVLIACFCCGFFQRRLPDEDTPKSRIFCSYFPLRLNKLIVTVVLALYSYRRL